MILGKYKPVEILFNLDQQHIIDIPSLLQLAAATKRRN